MESNPYPRAVQLARELDADIPASSLADVNVLVAAAQGAAENGDLFSFALFAITLYMLGVRYGQRLACTAFMMESLRHEQNHN